MSTSPLPSAWENPRHFSVPLPLTLDSFNPSLPQDLACSANHLVLGYANRFYIYSLPSFRLLHIIEAKELPRRHNLEIYGELLVVRRSYGSENSFSEASSLFIWDLSTGQNLGSVGLNFSHTPRISAPKPELVDIEQNGISDRQEWPKKPVLIITTTDSPRLRVYMRHSDGSAEEEQGESTMQPVTTIRPDHLVYGLASRGRTAVTGGHDATVRVWDIMSGECRLVLLGHTAYMNGVCMDQTRIYSSSGDSTVRVWDRRSGDCLHVLQVPVHASGRFTGLHITQSHLIMTWYITSTFYAICLWDPVSGTLVHHSPGHSGHRLGPIRGHESTLVKEDVRQDSSMHWLKIWDVRSSKISTSLPLGRAPYLPICTQDRYITAILEQDGQFVLKVWDFGSDGSVEEGEGIDDDRIDLDPN